MTNNEYQNSVIKDGKLVADWDALYRDFNDPWNQSTNDLRNSASRIMTKFYCEKFRSEFNAAKTLELGCGFAWMTEDLHLNGFKARGTDISEVCISKALQRNTVLDLHVANFNDEKHLIEFNPDIIIMSQITWYVLDELQNFLKVLGKHAKTGKPKFLIHSLATYPKKTQTLGLDFFTDGEQKKHFFNLEYIFSMSTEVQLNGSESQDTMFVAKL